MLTNELKKGDRVQLRNGWKATVMDNGRGNTRMCEVEGLYTEMGSVYSHDIMLHIPRDGSSPARIEHTEKQEKLRERVNLIGF
jgi:hypothetical protein